MRAEPDLVAKVGAEATIGVGLADGRGLALKVLDGGWRAMEPAAVHAVRQAFGLAAAGAQLDRHAEPPVANSRGEIVGSLVIRVALMSETS
jgi:L-asparaginase II